MKIYGFDITEIIKKMVSRQSIGYFPLTLSHIRTLYLSTNYLYIIFVQRAHCTHI